VLVAVLQHDPKFFLRYTRIYVDKPTAREETDVIEHDGG